MSMPPGPPGTPGAKVKAKGKGKNRRRNLIIGGAAAAGIAALALWQRSRSGTAAAAAGTDAPTAVQPVISSSGDDFDSLEAQISDLQSQVAQSSASPGPAGPAGPSGPAGPPGTPAKAKVPDPWQISKEALISQGSKNPTNSAIFRERKKLFGIGAKPPARKPGPVRKK